MAEHSDQELIETLKKTKEKFGPLYPILKDADGNIIDGFHRFEADPEWPTVIVDWLDSDVDFEALRLISNWIRREVSPSEKSQSLAKIAELTEWTPNEISENLGIPYRTVMRYIPDEYKRSGGYERNASIAIQDDITVPAGMLGSSVEDSTPLPSEPMEEDEGGSTVESEEIPAVSESSEDASTFSTEAPAPIEDEVKAEPTVQEFITEIYATNTYVRDDFIIDVLQSKFHLTYTNAKAELRKYWEKQRKPTQKETAIIKPTISTTTCPLCGSRIAVTNLQLALDNILIANPDIAPRLKEIFRK